MDTDLMVRLRVDGVKSSCERARLAFFIMLVASCAVIMTLYNDHFAWANHLTEDHRGLTEWPPQKARATSSDPRDEDVKRLEKKLWEEVVKNNADNSTVTVGLLGLRVDAGDLTLFGSLAMLIVSMYYCLCNRRASHDIESLLEDVREADVDVQKYVLAGVRQSLVLHMAVEAETISSASTRNQWPRTLRGLNSAFSFLTYLPTIAIAAIVLGDLKYAFFQSLDLYPNRLWWLLHLQRFYLVQFITLDVLAIATLVFVISVNRLTNRFQTATASAIERFIASGTGH